MIFILLGLILWFAGHLLGRSAPALRAKIGGRAAVALINLAALLLLIFGYRSAEGSFFWGRSPALTGINNLLMLIAVYLCAAHGMKTAVTRKLRHPLLWAVVLWAVAHLMVNGDTPSFLLFGGLGLWAFAQMAAVSASEGAFVPPAAKPVKFEGIALVGTLVVYGAAAGLHYALGYPAFG